MGKLQKFDVLPSNRSAFIEGFWLGLGDISKIQTANSIGNHELFKDNPHLALIDLMRKPENFAYTCQILFNIELHPFQVNILKTLWTHPFSILMMTRGGSKTFCLSIYSLLRALFTPESKIILTGSSFRQSKLIFSNCEAIYRNSQMLKDILSFDNHNKISHDTDMYQFTIFDSTIKSLPTGCLIGDTLITTDKTICTLKELRNCNDLINGNGKFKKIGQFFDNGIQKVIGIKTKKGYRYTATENHKMKICRDNKIQWIRTDEMSIGDKILIDRSQRWHNNDTIVTKDEAYCLGLMIGDGNYTRKRRLRYTTIDPEFLVVLNRTIGMFRPEKDCLHYNFDNTNGVNNWINYWGLKRVRGFRKSLPKMLLNSSKEKVRACLQGLFDTDGHVVHIYSKGGMNSTVGFTNTSRKLIKQMRYILLHFGIISSVYERIRISRRTGRKCRKCYDLQINGNNVKLFYEHVGFRLQRKKDELEYIIRNKKRWMNHDDNIPLDMKLLPYKVRGKAKVFSFYRYNKYKDSMDWSPELLELCNNDYFYDIISEINLGKISQTYDINVPSDNEYCANGFYSHNSGEKIRGQRACVHPNSILETELGLMRISDYEKYITDSCPCVVTGDNKLPLEKPSRFIITPKIDAYRVKTMGGYDFICSDIHQCMTTAGWKLAKDLTEEDSLVFKNDYKFPDKNIVIDGIELDENLAWLLGILLAKGCVTTKGVFSIRMADEDCINRIVECWKRFSDKNNLNLNIRKYENPERIDVRGWINKKSWTVNICNWKLREKLLKFGLDRVKARKKRIPSSILMSPRKSVLAFLAGLMEGNGTCFYYKTKMSNKSLSIAFYSGSRQLCDEVHVLFAKFGLFTSKGFRASKLSIGTQFFVRLYGDECIRLYEMLDVPKWYKFKDNYYRNKVVHRKKTELAVRSVKKLDEQISLRDLTLPNTHSFYAHGFIQHNTDLICDEFNSIDINVYEEVIQGFGAVNASPIAKVKEHAKLAAMLELGDISEETFQSKISEIGSNRQIISGTCGYTFEHLFKYWKRYHDIIMSQGDKKKLDQIFNSDIPINFNWKDYAIVRIPFDILPPAYMSDKTVGQARATTNTGIFSSEFQTCFISDSMGFFRRTLIEQCVARNTNPPISKTSCGIVEFTAGLRGNKERKYVMGIDPAAEQDNFAIVILEIWSDHRRIVYCWTVTKEIHKAKLKYGLTNEHDYYRFCSRKIRDLKKAFNIEWIAMDAQGGGGSIMETLGDPNNLQPGENPIYPIKEDDINKDTDNLPGEHILHMIQFSKAQWVYDANHGLRKDMETCELMFPLKDSLAFGVAREEDKIFKRIKISEDDPDVENLCDTLENNMLEIEELKNELVLIEHTKTDSGRDKWDTPQVKGVGARKGRLRKDRYSALLMANMIGRSFIARLLKEEYPVYGNTAQELKRNIEGRNDYSIGFGISKHSGRKRF